MQRLRPNLLIVATLGALWVRSARGQIVAFEESVRTDATQIRPRAAGDVSDSSGTFTYRFPISVPPGRAGLQPDLALVYSSDLRTVAGWAGAGWTFELPSVKRSTRHGAAPTRLVPGTGAWPNPIYVYDDAPRADAPTFELDGQDLVEVTGGLERTYRGRLDPTLRATFHAAARPTYWAVETGNGRRMLFGRTDDYPEINTAAVPGAAVQNEMGTFEWGLVRVEDAAGNRIDVSYHGDNHPAPEPEATAPFDPPQFAPGACVQGFGECLVMAGITTPQCLEMPTPDCVQFCQAELWELWGVTNECDPPPPSPIGGPDPLPPWMQLEDPDNWGRLFTEGWSPCLDEGMGEENPFTAVFCDGDGVGPDDLYTMPDFEPLPDHVPTDCDLVELARATLAELWEQKMARLRACANNFFDCAPAAQIIPTVCGNLDCRESWLYTGEPLPGEPRSTPNFTLGDVRMRRFVDLLEHAELLAAAKLDPPLETHHLDATTLVTREQVFTQESTLTATFPDETVVTPKDPCDWIPFADFDVQRWQGGSSVTIKPRDDVARLANWTSTWLANKFRTAIERATKRLHWEPKVVDPHGNEFQKGTIDVCAAADDACDWSDVIDAADVPSPMDFLRGPLAEQPDLLFQTTWPPRRALTPTRIDYGANPGAGLAHAYQVQLARRADARADGGPNWREGGVVQPDLLDEIRVLHGAARVRTYELDYQTSRDTLRPLLTAIREWGGVPGAAGVPAMPAVSFGYQGNWEVGADGTWRLTARWTAADATDVLGTNAIQSAVAELSHPVVGEWAFRGCVLAGGGLSECRANLESSGPFAYQLADLNADAFPDLLHCDLFGGSVPYCNPELERSYLRSRFGHDALLVGVDSVETEIARQIDVDGDGLLDFVAYGTDEQVFEGIGRGGMGQRMAVVYRNLGDGLYDLPLSFALLGWPAEPFPWAECVSGASSDPACTLLSWTGGDWTPESSLVDAADLDGDGLSELVLLKAAAGDEGRYTPRVWTARGGIVAPEFRTSAVAEAERVALPGNRSGFTPSLRRALEAQAIVSDSVDPLTLPVPADWLIPEPGAEAAPGLTMFIDFNGDGLPDLYAGVPLQLGGTGTGGMPDTEPLGGLALDDIVERRGAPRFSPAVGAYRSIGLGGHVYLNRGHAFTLVPDDVLWFGSDLPATSYSTSEGIDLLCRDGVVCELARRSGETAGAGNPPARHRLRDAIPTVASRWMDLNADALVDLVVARRTPAGTFRRRVYLNTGHSLIESSDWADALPAGLAFAVSNPLSSVPSADVPYLTNGTTAADLDGDQIVDFLLLPEIWVDGGNPNARVLLGQGRVPDLLVRVANGLGAATDVEYASSRDYPHATPESLYGDDAEGVIIAPPRQVVARVVESPGFGPAKVRSYAYADGLHDVRDRRSLGFRQVEILEEEVASPGVPARGPDPGDVDTTPTRRIVRSYHQVGGPVRSLWAGLLRHEQIEDLAGASEARALSYDDRWDRVAHLDGDGSPATRYDGVYLRPLFAEERTVCDGATCALQTTAHAYNAWGQVLATCRGDATASRKETRGYLNQVAPTWRIGLVYQEATYDASGAPCVADGVGADQVLLAETRSFYDGNTGNPAAQTVGQGLLTREQSRRLGTPADCGGGEAWATTDHVWDTSLGVVSETRTLGYTTGDGFALDATPARVEGYAYDDGLRIRPTARTITVGAAAQTTSASYDARFGELASLCDPNGACQEWEYDGLGRLAVERAPDGDTAVPTELRAWSYEWESSPPRTTAAESVAGAARTRVLYHDGRGRLLQEYEQAPEGWALVRAPLYDAWSQEVSEAVPAFYATAEYVPWRGGARSGVWFDGLGRRIVRYTADLRRTDWVHAAREVVRIDPNGHRALEIRDALGRLQLHAREDLAASRGGAARPARMFDTAWPQAVTSYEWLGQRPTRIVDPMGHVRDAAWDEADRLVATTLPRDAGGAAAWFVSCRDGRGNVVRSATPAGRVVTRTFDALDRETSRSAAGGDVPLPPYTFAYDFAPGDTPQPYGVGRLLRVEHDGVAWRYRYDAQGRTSSRRMTLADGRDYQAAWVHHLDDRVQSIAYPDPTGAGPGELTVSYLYDLRGGVTDVLAGDLPLLTDARYGADGLIGARAFGHGVETTWGYDPTSRRLESIVTGDAAGAPLQSLSFAYDPTGNVLNMADAADPDWGARTFTYDGQDRLRSETRGGPWPWTEWFDYDAAGRMLRQGSRDAYTYGLAANRHAVTSTTASWPGGSFTSHYEYDDDGLLAADGYRALSWNAAGQLAGVIDASYAYDPAGARYRKDSFHGETIYFADLFETRGDGALRRYSVSIGDERIALVEIDDPSSGTPLDYDAVLFLHKDHLRSTTLTTRGGGAGATPTVSRRTYGAYGRGMSSSGDEEVPYRFTGKERDAETGYDYFGARYYDSELARWLSPDPAFLGEPALAVADPQQGDLYGYSRGNPLVFRDPEGAIIDTLWDLGNVAYDLGKMVYGAATGNERLMDEGARDALLDAGAALIPGLPAGLGRGARVLDDAAERGARGLGQEGAERGARGATPSPSAGAGGGVRETPKDILLPSSRYPESAKHTKDAQAAGKPDVLTIERGGAGDRRRDALKGHDPKPGRDRDEYPPAMTREGGKGSDVKDIKPSDNRGWGACMGKQCRDVPDGGKIRIVVVDE